MRFTGRNKLPVPDAELIRTLAALLGESGLSEIEYEVGGYRIRVARQLAAPAPAVPPVAPSGEPQATRPPAGSNGAFRPGTVTAPLVGVAYLAPQPGDPPFVRIGDSVEEGQTLLIIEAMKVMNQIRSPQAGRVTDILVEDAAAVEYGAALMQIE